MCGQIKPGLWDEPRRLTQFWDVEGISSAEGVKVELRVLHAYETFTKRERFGKQWIETVEDHHWWWATTIPSCKLPTPQLWEAGHRRWDIENDLFNTLSTHWAMEHFFKHEPTAIVNFVLTLFIAFVLLQSFYLRNLKPTPNPPHPDRFVRRIAPECDGAEIPVSMVGQRRIASSSLRFPHFYLLPESLPVQGA